MGKQLSKAERKALKRQKAQEADVLALAQGGTAVAEAEKAEETLENPPETPETSEETPWCPYCMTCGEFDSFANHPGHLVVVGYEEYKEKVPQMIMNRILDKEGE